MNLGDLLARTVVGAMGKGVAAVTREVQKEVQKTLGKFAAECDAVGELPTCCNGSLVPTKDGSRVLYLHDASCARAREK